MLRAGLERVRIADQIDDAELTHVDTYMTSQLLLVSHDRLAQYWETFGHVSFYQRVNIDEFTKV